MEFRKTYTSNTLWNSQDGKPIALSQQLYDDIIDWSNPDYSMLPDTIKKDISKFQSKLNDFFLRHYQEFQEFLHGKGVEDVIDTWQDVVDFLAGIQDDPEQVTLLKFIEYIEGFAGHLNIRMSDTIPGMVEAVTLSDILAEYPSSAITEDTGAIVLKYNFLESSQMQNNSGNDQHSSKVTPDNPDITEPTTELENQDVANGSGKVDTGSQEDEFTDD